MKLREPKGIVLFAILAVVALVVYSPLYGVGFVTDFLGWIECQQSTPLFQSHLCFQNRGLYYIPFIVLSILSDLFSHHPMPWFVVFTGLHALNAYLVAHLLKTLHTVFEVPYKAWPGLTAAVLFMLYPYQVEVVAWKACINYLTTAALMMLATIQYLRWWQGESIRGYTLALGLFLLSLFNLEFAVLLPVLLAGLHILLPTTGQHSGVFRKVARSLLPFVGAVVVFFLVNRLVIGKAVGHYVVEASAFNPLSLASAELKYAFKILGFGRFWPYGTQDSIYTALSSPLAGGVALAGIATFATWLVVRKKQLSSNMLLRSFVFFGALLFILPIAHLYFYYLQFSENDRYTYFAMIFVSMLLPMLLGNLQRIGKVILALYVIGALGGALFLNSLWQRSHAVHEHLVETFRWQDHSEVYILNLPDNLRGIFMFRNIGGDSAFEEVLTLLNGQSFKGNMYDIYQYNMATSTDGVSVVQNNDLEYQATFNQWGNWWWRNGIGGTNYETDKYAAGINGQSFTVRFKDLAQDAAIIYFDGTNWQEAN